MRHRDRARLAAVTVFAAFTTFAVAPSSAAAAACTSQLPKAVTDVDEAPWEQQRYDVGRLSTFATGAGITVAVIDSGVDNRHPQLASRVVGGNDFLDKSAAGLQDCVGHGTAVASVIAAVPANNRF